MTPLLILLASASLASAALNVDLDSPDSIKAAAKAVASNLMSYYKGNMPGQTPGILPGPPPAGDYYWWEGGALWGTMVDYWHLTGDTTWNDVTQSSLVFQAGSPGNSYMPENWTLSLGNDDQGFWGMSAMLAAENKFQNPPTSDPQWLALAQAVFNTQAAPDRRDGSCGGGLRWQIFVTNKGYGYKNSIANGIFFNLGARLARYTGNTTYSDWAIKTWDWMTGVGLIDENYNVYDGAYVDDNCSVITKTQFSYSAAAIAEGVAFMYNHTEGADQAMWLERLQGLVNTTMTYFFPNETATEVCCELADRVQCNTDQLSFKGYLHRWMATTAQIAPVVYEQVFKVLKVSAAAALTSCSNGVDNGNGVSTATCGFRWNTGSYDGNTGAGQQMNVLGALVSMLVTAEQKAAPPVTNSTGGTSVGNSNAGNQPSVLQPPPPVATKDKVGAGILTTLLMASLLSMVVWINTDWLDTALVSKHSGGST